MHKIHINGILKQKNITPKIDKSVMTKKVTTKS